MKRCTKCGEWKGFSEYHKDGKVSGGLRARCKACVAEYKMKYWEANKEKCAEYQRKYREANKEKCAEYWRKYREENWERFLENQRKYQEKIRHEKRFMETMNAISELSNKKEG